MKFNYLFLMIFNIKDY
ncbi:hypothetical protein M9Y10_030630 [Tritrichomonas musculus]|uniref:Uncharacterized protein n=1 Tax=Tritrichomonas musculus TaxID=1915356 RepID=A0ABR2H3K9_9EUKA